MQSGLGMTAVMFLGLPDLTRLCCVTLTLPDSGEEPRSKQIKTCRELVLLYSEVLVSPALDSFADITVVMAVPFFQTGVLQLFGERRRLQLGPPQCVFPGVLQCCLSYSLINRLAPRWNKAGLYLVTGKDFLSKRGRLAAVSMELNTSQGQLCFSIEANTVRLPPPTLELDFDFPPLLLRRFCSDPYSVLDPSSTGGAIWCHVLPSMKKGQIINISRKLPPDGPFRTYQDLQNHWNSLYGYRLPDLSEEDVVYCSVYFRLVGERLFTYPLSCIRLQPVQRCPHGDLQWALGSFLSDIRDRLQSVCGLQARLSNKPCYRTAGVNTVATVQVLSGEQVNLTSSTRLVLSQLPPPPPPLASQPGIGSQPPSLASLSQQDTAQGLLGNACAFRGNLTQHQGSFSISSSSFLPLLQPASSFNTSSYSLSSLPPPSPVPVAPSPKLVPIFRNKCPLHHISVALLRLQKQKEQLSGGGGKTGRMTLPSLGKKTPTTMSSSSSSVCTLPITSLPSRPPPTFPHFNHRSKPPQAAGHPNVKHRSSLSPPSQSRPGIRPAPKLEIKFKSRSYPKPILKQSCERKTAADGSGEAQEPPLASSDESSCSSSSRRRVGFELKPKKSRSAVQGVDVEKMARSNQLYKLSSTALLAWLRGRGAHVSGKHRKGELILKVMSCLAET